MSLSRLLFFAYQVGCAALLASIGLFTLSQLQELYVQQFPAIPLFPGPAWYEYNTTRFEGFPNAENPYAQGSFFGSGTPEQLIVMTTITPK